MFERLTVAMQRPDLLEKFRDQVVRLKSRKEVFMRSGKMDPIYGARRFDRNLHPKWGAGGAINSIADIFEDPHFEARKLLKRLMYLS